MNLLHVLSTFKGDRQQLGSTDIINRQVVETLQPYLHWPRSNVLGPTLEDIISSYPIYELICLGIHGYGILDSFSIDMICGCGNPVINLKDLVQPHRCSPAPSYAD